MLPADVSSAPKHTGENGGTSQTPSDQDQIIELIKNIKRNQPWKQQNHAKEKQYGHS